MVVGKQASTVKHRQVLRRKHPRTKFVLRLLDFEHAKSAVLNSLTSSDAQRGYRHAMVADSSELMAVRAFMMTYLCLAITTFQSAGGSLSLKNTVD
jgi:hypothetical protein